MDEEDKKSLMDFQILIIKLNIIIKLQKQPEQEYSRPLITILLIRSEETIQKLKELVNTAA